MDERSHGILIVEDSLVQAEGLRRILAGAGYQVEVAHDGVEGLELAQKLKPSLVISDVSMPLMDGYELCGRIKGNEGLSNTRVMLVTQLTDVRAIAMGIDAGADAYITKPYSERYLLSRIRAILEGPGEEQRMLESAVASADRQRLWNILMSTYENALEQNRVLAEARRDLEEMNEKLRTANRDLHAANNELEAFVYSASHDLRAPLRAINGFAHIVADDYAERLDDEGRHHLHVIAESARRMAQLIDDLLSYSRTGRCEMTSGPIDMTALAAEVSEEQRAQAAGRTIEIAMEALPAASGDSAMMRQVWVNLLSNSVKFTRPREPARIEIGGRTEGRENIYCVKDNGVGFDMQYAEKLFGVFQRLHGAGEFEGTGLGLAIAQRVIHRHGGRVWAEGTPGEGALFCFSLPSRS